MVCPQNGTAVLEGLSRGALGYLYMLLVYRRDPAAIGILPCVVFFFVIASNSPVVSDCSRLVHHVCSRGIPNPSLSVFVWTALAIYLPRGRRAYGLDSAHLIRWFTGQQQHVTPAHRTDFSPSSPLDTLVP